MRVLQLLALLLLPAVASATQVRAMDLAELAAESDVVVWAKVTETAAEPVPETPKRYHTRVAVSVLRTLRTDRAPAPAALEFELLGGAVGRYAQFVPGTPRITVGDEIVIMLGRTASGRLQISGFNQGFWRVTRGPFGPTVAVSDRRGAELIQTTALGGPRTTVVPSVDARSLDALLADLTAALAVKNQDAP